MGLASYRLLDQYLAAPRLNAARDRQSSRPSAGSSLPLRRGDGLSTSLRRASFRWLRGFASLAQVRSRRMSFASPSPKLSTARGGDASSLARRARALDALARTTAAVQAGQSIADPRCPQGDLRPI